MAVQFWSVSHTHAVHHWVAYLGWVTSVPNAYQVVDCWVQSKESAGWRVHQMPEVPCVVFTAPHGCVIRPVMWVTGPKDHHLLTTPAMIHGSI
jgi:hypothetical protein